MSYVYHQPSQQSSQQQNQNQNKNKYKVQEAERSPFGKMAAWVINKAAGTALEGFVNFFLGETLIGRLATVIAVGISVGAITDLVIVAIPTISTTTILGAQISTPLVMSVIAGAGAGGLGGAILGGLWGWLIGQIVDAVTANSVSNQIQSNISPVITWVIATISGTLAGNVAIWAFNKISGTGIRRFIAKLFMLVVLAAISYVVFIIVMSFEISFGQNELLLAITGVILIFSTVGIFVYLSKSDQYRHLPPTPSFMLSLAIISPFVLIWLSYFFSFPKSIPLVIVLFVGLLDLAIILWFPKFFFDKLGVVITILIGLAPIYIVALVFTDMNTTEALITASIISGAEILYFLSIGAVDYFTRKHA